MEGRLRALRPHVHTLDRAGEHYRAGVHWGPIVGQNTTVRVHCANGDRRDFVTATSNLSDQSIGAPVVVKFTNTTYASIASFHATHWGGGGPGTDQAGAVARGHFFFCVIPRAITGASEEYEWTDPNSPINQRK